MLIPKLPLASLAITTIIILIIDAVAAASGLGQPEIAVAPPPQPQNLDMHHLSKRMDLEVCIGHFDVHKNTIIRTGESQAIGGKYLQGLELDTIEECERLCCETDACDVYIFERKSGGYCYLFECGPPENFHCKFTRHANYTSAVLTPQVRETGAEVAKSSTPKPQLPHIPSNNISQQEWELTNLKLKPEVKDSVNNNNNNKPAIVAGGSVAVASVAAPSTSGVVQSPNVVVVAPVQSAPLGHCGRFQFTCHSGECVAIYNACDGIPQCEDGSDEGPECNAISSSATKVSNNNNNLDMPKPIVVQQQQQQYQPLQSSSVQQQQQQHQVLILGPPPPPPPPPPRVNNREDAAAWTNRKLIVDGQQQQQQQQGEILNADEQSHIFNHKGGLQLQQQQQAAIGQQIQAQAPGQGQGQGQVVQVQPGQMQLSSYNNNQNLGASSVYGMSGVYLTPPQQQQQPSQQQQQQLQPAALQPLPSNIVAWPKPVQIAAHQPQQQLLVPQQQQQPQQSQTYAVVPPPPPPPPPQQQQPQQSMLPVLNSAPTHDKGQLADDEYDYDEEEKSTEAPKKKQRKHKKIKTKTSKDPIELALEQNKEQHQQQQQQQPLLPALPVPVAPVHEQYKAIHENLALEFRDHDGHSERPGGAVLSLTMGLLVTAALAILIGCRMRTVGRRARRVGGKSPYSQEADFLVNGMYL